MFQLYLFRDRAFSLSKPAKSFLLLNFASVLLFAILYKAVSRYEHVHSDAAKKGEEPKNSVGDNLWFSLITQSTVGYGSSAYQDMSMLKKVINMVQLLSIFVIAALLI
jgi:hypothetical protein